MHLYGADNRLQTLTAFFNVYDQFHTSNVIDSDFLKFPLPYKSKSTRILHANIFWSFSKIFMYHM